MHSQQYQQFEETFKNIKETIFWLRMNEKTITVDEYKVKLAKLDVLVDKIKEIVNEK